LCGKIFIDKKEKNKVKQRLSTGFTHLYLTCHEISTGSVGAGGKYGFTMSFIFIILEYPFIFLNWWKEINRCKCTFLFLNSGVELAWGKLKN